MNQLCRACLMARESFTYVLYENVSADVYSFCTSVEVNQDDKLPKTLCNTCHELLHKFSDFKRTCIQAQNTLVFQNNIKSANEECPEDTNVGCGLDKKCVVVVSFLKDSDDIDIHEDLNNDRKDHNNHNEDYNNDHDEFDNDQNDIALADVLSEDDNEPLKEIKKKIKCTIKKVKVPKGPKNGVTKPKVFEYVCELCKSKFKYKERYEAHKLGHQGQTVNKTCPICKKVFMTWSGLQRHTDSEHKVVRISTLRCKACGKVFRNQQTLKLHSKLHELPEDRMSVCDICGKSYASPVTLRLHLEGHNENRARDFPCEHCGKKFFTKYILHSHIKRLHTGQRYICQICNYPFTDKYNLAKHVQQKHQGIRDHKCDICDKFFSSHSTLVIHKRIHSGERPYNCGYCVKAFSSKNRLIVHHRTHTGERPHRCVVCNLAFTQLGTMKRHLKTHNKPLGPQNLTGGSFQFETQAPSDVMQIGDVTTNYQYESLTACPQKEINKEQIDVTPDFHFDTQSECPT